MLLRTARLALILCAYTVILAPLAQASPAQPQDRNWKHLSLEQTIAAQRHLIVRDQLVIARYVRAKLLPRQLTLVEAPPRLRVAEPTIIRFYRAHLRWTMRELNERLRAVAARERAAARSDLGAWTCIHSGPGGNGGEGAWNANTGNGFYGGLQMDYGFMETYGPPVLGYPSTRAGRAAMFAARGTADRWSPPEQIAVARYARDHGRGYYPWPNTARACGLL